MLHPTRSLDGGADAGQNKSKYFIEPGWRDSEERESSLLRSLFPKILPIVSTIWLVARSGITKVNDTEVSMAVLHDIAWMQIMVVNSVLVHSRHDRGKSASNNANGLESSRWRDKQKRIAHRSASETSRRRRSPSYESTRQCWPLLIPVLSKRGMPAPWSEANVR
jgi:hypothetical protein